VRVPGPIGLLLGTGCARGMRVTFLGTAGSWPTKDRSASAIALDLEKELILLDCGEGTQRQFFQSSASFMRVRRVFLTHFHGDHFLGLPGLIQSMCLNHRTEPLDIYGPPDAEEMVGRALKMGYFTLRFPVTVHALSPDVTVDFEGYSVRTARADHPVPALAFRVEEGPKRGRFDGALARSLGIRGRDFARLEAGDPVRVDDHLVHPSDVMGPPRPGRSVVYSGDTAPSDEVRRLAYRATLLIHESTTAQDLEAEANEWGHSSARQAADLARAAEVSTLFLTHFSARYKELEPLETEARLVFPGSLAARDLLDHLIHQP
jgi:ribonuclease Z